MATLRTSGPLVTFAAQVEGAAPVIVSLSRFGNLVSDWRPFWREAFAPHFYDQQARNFETEGGFVGKWAALSPRYAAWKAKHFPGRPILQRRGTLIRSLTSRTAPFAVYRESAMGLEIGTSDPTAAYHHRGTRRMPMRRVLFLAQAETYGRMMQRWVVEQARAAGLTPTGARRATA